MDLQTQAVNSNVAARRSVVGTSVGWAGGGEPGGWRLMKLTLKFVSLVLLRFQWPGEIKSIFQPLYGKATPAPKNLYSLFHIGRIWPMVLSEVTISEWLRLDVMIVPVGNILK